MKKDDDAEFHKPQCNLFKPHLKTRNKYPRLLIAALSKCWACETLFSVFFVLWIQNHYGQAGQTASRVKPMLYKCEELRMKLQTPHKDEYAHVSAFQCSKGNLGGRDGELPEAQGWLSFHTWQWTTKIINFSKKVQGHLRLSSDPWTYAMSSVCFCSHT